jgi:hypothetical protein
MNMATTTNKVYRLVYLTVILLSYVVALCDSFNVVYHRVLDKVRLGSFNIRFLCSTGGRNYLALMQLIAKLEVDFLVIQELTMELDPEEGETKMKT